jgi:hypothetical protein
MGLYGNDIYNDELFILDESFLDKETMDLIRNWKTANEIHSKKKFKSTSLSQEEYNTLKETFDIMLETEDYTVYKKAFDKLCRFCHIVPRGVIITKHELKKGNSDNNSSLYLEYAENYKKIKLPEGTKLFHISKVEGIKELIPQYRGKSERGYLYDKPRVYLTIRKNMPKFLADYKLTEKMHKYEVTKDITDVYIDPLVYTNIQGAVYIETKNPIPVEEMGIVKKENNEEEKKETAENESFDTESFLDFVTENNLSIIEYYE